MTFTNREVELALARLKGIPFFPTADLTQIVIIEQILAFTESEEALDWSTRKALQTMRKWSLPDFKGIYCAGGFTPLDGQFQSCAIEGVKPVDEPNYYKPYQRLLPPPPDDPVEEAKLKADMVDLEAKIKTSAAKRQLKSAIAEARHRQGYQPPDWLQ